MQCAPMTFGTVKRLLQRTITSIRAETPVCRASHTAEEQKSVSLLPERHADMKLKGVLYFASLLPPCSLQQLLPQRMLQNGNWAVTQVVGPA